MTLIRTLLRHAFVRFAVVGGGGYIVNAAVLAVDTGLWGMDVETGLAVSIFVSMCCTWLGNRYLTFRERRARTLSGITQEWLKFMGANLVGAVVNYGITVLLVHFAPPPFNNKYVAQIGGVLAGLVFNFTLSKKLVFKEPI